MIHFSSELSLPMKLEISSSDYWPVIPCAVSAWMGRRKLDITLSSTIISISRNYLRRKSNPRSSRPSRALWRVFVIDIAVDIVLITFLGCVQLWYSLYRGSTCRQLRWGLQIVLHCSSSVLRSLSPLYQWKGVTHLCEFIGFSYNGTNLPISFT